MIYIFHIHHQSCRACGKQESISSLYLAEALPSPGKAVKLLPCESIGPQSAIHVVHLPTKQVPLCSHCIGTFSQEAVAREVWLRWQETLRKKASEGRVSPPKKKEESLA